VKKKFKGKVREGKLIVNSKSEVTEFLSLIDGSNVVISIEKAESKRTLTQNAAIHKYFEIVASAFRQAGIDSKVIFNEQVDVPVTAGVIKEGLWRPVQNALLEKQSTTKLTTKEVSEIYDIVNKHLGEKFGIHVPFPSHDFYMEE